MQKTVKAHDKRKPVKVQNKQKAVSVQEIQKPVKVQDKYYLKSLHEEIDLYDRKLAHMTKYELFASDSERETAIRKMTTKRGTLVKTAKKLVKDGVEFHPSDLPRSFRPQTESAEQANIA